MRITTQLLILVILAGGAAGAYAYRDQLPVEQVASLTGLTSPDGAAPGAGAARAGGRRGPSQTAVTAVEVTMQRRGDRVAAVGSGRANRSLDLATREAGVVEEIAFSPGETVERGQPLVMLESDAEQIAVDRAEAAREAAQATVNRYEQLLRSNSVSAVQLEQAQTELKVAEADLAAARHALERRTVRAPFSGVVGLTSLTVGDYLATGDTVTTIDDRTPLIVEFTVPEAAASSVAIGQEVRSALVSRPGRIYQGTVTALDSRLDPASRTLRVEASLPNEDGALIPGSTFSVALQLEGELAPAVPGLSVQWDRGGAYVWRLVGEGGIERVPVAILDRGGREVLVDAPLSGGDRVIYEGGDQVRQGQTVQARVVPFFQLAADPTLSERQPERIDERVQ